MNGLEKPQQERFMTKKKTYDVGYGKPPEATQFKKGQSGNPNGRPKGTRNLKTDVVAVLKKPVPISEGGRKRHISTQEAALMRLRDKALKGDARALDRLLALAATYNNEELQELTTERLDTEDEAILADFLNRNGGTT